MRIEGWQPSRVVNNIIYEDCDPLQPLESCQ